MSEYLKIKIKNLADEASLIRRHERRHLGQMRKCLAISGEDHAGYADRHYDQYQALRFHRQTRVRQAARESLLAYGFLRGRRYRQMEATCREEPNWKTVERMIKKYGGFKAAEGFEAWCSQEPLDQAA